MAAAGVICARVVPNFVEAGTAKLALYLIGVALGLGGLVIVLYAMRRPSP